MTDRLQCIFTTNSDPENIPCIAKYLLPIFGFTRIVSQSVPHSLLMYTYMHYRGKVLPATNPYCGMLMSD